MADNRIRATAGRPVATPVVCGVLGGLVVLACALQGTLHGSSPAAPPPPPRSGPVDPSEYSFDGGPAAPMHLSRQPPQPWVTTAALVVGAVALAVLAGVLLGVWWRRRRKPAPPVATLTGAVVGTAMVDAAAATTGRRVAPAAGAPAPELPPGDAVVRAWVALQDAAAGAGVPRGPAETPTEFTERLLDEVGVPRAVVEELRGLYLTARFSGRAVEPADAERAVRAAHLLSQTWPPRDVTT